VSTNHHELFFPPQMRPAAHHAAVPKSLPASQRSAAVATMSETTANASPQMLDEYRSLLDSDDTAVQLRATHSIRRLLSLGTCGRERDCVAGC